MYKLFRLHEMAEYYGLESQRLGPRRGWKSCFIPEGKVVLMLLKLYTQQSAPKLMEKLNGVVHYQMHLYESF